MIDRRHERIAQLLLLRARPIATCMLRLLAELSCGRSAVMEEFSVAAKANAQKFLAGFADKPVPTIKVDAPPPLPLHWPRIADYELEGTVLDMVRCYLAVK